MNYWSGFITVFLLGAVLCLGIPLLIRRRANSPAVKKVAENMALILFSLLVTLMAAEFYFKVFFAQTDNRTFTLASKNWFERYWALNSAGYRDIEWTPAMLQRRKILVSGDSFAAGQGIENIDDRFSNLLGQKLGPDYLVMNIAHPGYSTYDEIKRLQGFPFKPQILIHQYFINDIRHAAEEQHVKLPDLKIEPSPLIAPLVNNSYAFNFIYWRAILFGPKVWQGDNLAWLKMVYSDPGVWWVHQQELQMLSDGATSEGVQLIVVVFPILTDVEGSRDLTDQVVSWFRAKNVPVLDVAELVDNLPPEQLVVSSIDAHPSPWLHARVSEALYQIIEQLPSQPQTRNE